MPTLVPYPTRTFTRPAFTALGYTLLVPRDAGPETIPSFWSEIEADGRLEAIAGVR